MNVLAIGCHPDIIITHSPDDYMRDHVETSKLVFNARLSSSITHLCKVQTMFHDSTSLLHGHSCRSGILKKQIHAVQTRLKQLLTDRVSGIKI